jgi:hypothetical protein
MFANVPWMAATTNMTTSPPGATTIYPRDCFACGEPMIPAAKGSHTLICKPCEITENGTIRGKFPRDSNTGGMWGNELIPYLDHGDTNAPSPDTMGSNREPVRLAEPPAPAEGPEEDGAGS